MRSLPHLAACGLALLLVAAPTAEARKKAPLTDATYDVTVRATMDETWSFDEQSAFDCLPGQCTKETKGSGSAHLALKSKPTPWMVLRGYGGRPPQINVGDGEGAHAVGPSLRQGDLSTVHGGTWAAANPPEVSPATGCGTKPADLAFNLSFTKRDTLAPSVSTDLDREDCPDGPSSGLDWDGGESPSLGDVTTTTSQTRFLKARSFTVRGTRTWHASVQPPTGAYTFRSGEKRVTWSWEVTFNMRKKAHR